MNFAGSKGRYALVGWLFVSCAMTACSGDDNTGGAGGGNMGGGAGTGGNIVRDGATDARDASPGTGGADAGPDRAGDARADATGGAGGADTGPDRAAGGAGGSAGDARAEGTGGGGTGGNEAGTGGSEAGTGGSEAGTGGSEAGTGGSEAGTGGSEAGTGGGTATDAAEAGADVSDASPVPDVTPPGDASDGSVADRGPDVSPAPDASDVTPVPSDADRALCDQPIPGGALIVSSFDTAAEATWQFDQNSTLGTGMYPPPAGAQDPAFDNTDGCPTPGQLRFTIPFDSHAGSPDDGGVTTHPQGARYTVDFSPLADWTGRTTLHIRLMVETSGGLEFINPFSQLGSVFAFNPRASLDYTRALLGVGVWRDLTIDISQVNPRMASNIGFEVFATSPGTVVFDIDSIWVE